MTLWANVLSIDNPANIQGETNLFINTSAFIAIDPASVKELFEDNWEGDYTPRNGTNLALASAKSEIGVRHNGWLIGYSHRLETMIEASRDTIDLIHTVQNSDNLPIGKEYNLDLKINGFQADGLHIAHSIPLYTSNNFNIHGGIGISLLRGIRLQQGLVNGSATVISDKNYDFYGTTDYYYSDNYLYELGLKMPSGYGASTDIGINTDWEMFHVELVLNDLLGFLKWNKTPYTHAILTSDTKSYDSKGYIEYSPTVKGIETTKAHTQYLDSKGFAMLQYNMGFAMPFLQVSTTRGYIFPEFGLLVPIANTSKIKVSYESFFQSYEIMLVSKYGFIGVQSNNIRPERASALGVSLGLQYIF